MVYNPLINYHHAAQIIGVGPRQVRRIFEEFDVKPLRRGHRTVRIPLQEVLSVRDRLFNRTVLEAMVLETPHGKKHRNERK